MSMRETINENPLVAGLVIVALLAVAGGAYLLIGGGSIGGPPPKYWHWYDLNTGEVFVAQANDTMIREVDTGSEPAVRASVYGCGGCGEDQRFVGTLHKMEDGKEMVSLPEPIDWMSTGHPRAGEILGDPVMRCEDEPGDFTPCGVDPDEAIAEG